MAPCEQPHAGLFSCPKTCVHFVAVCPSVGPQVGPLCVQDSWQGSKGRQPFCRWGWTYVWTYTLCVHPPSGLWLSRLWLSRWTSATARELESAAYFFTEKAGYENTPSLTNGYCIPDRSPLGLHPSGHPAKHKDSLPPIGFYGFLPLGAGGCAPSKSRPSEAVDGRRPKGVALRLCAVFGASKTNGLREYPA